MLNASKSVTAATYDIDYSLNTIQTLLKIESYKNIKETSKTSLEFLELLTNSPN